MIFPNVERALQEILNGVITVGSYLPKGMSDRIPYARLSPIPSAGGTEPFLHQERIQVMVYDKGRTDAKELANKIVSVLDGKPHASSHGLLDLVEVVSYPAEAPLEDDTLNLFELSLNIHTRPMKEVS